MKGKGSPISQGTVLYRFRLNLADVDRSVYERLDFRLALHPSESFSFLLTRMLAYVLNVEPGLEFSSKGLGDPEEACLSSEDPRGGKKIWIEIGNPSGRRLHKASKASKLVKVYTYKDPIPLLREIKSENVHHGDKIEVYALAEEFLSALESLLDRDNEWSILRDGESLLISAPNAVVQGDLKRLQ